MRALSPALRALLGSIVGITLLFAFYIFLKVPLLPCISVYATMYVSTGLFQDVRGSSIFSTLFCAFAGFALYLMASIVAVIHYPQYGNVLGVIFYFLDAFAFLSAGIWAFKALSQDTAYQQRRQMARELAKLPAPEDAVKDFYPVASSARKSSHACKPKSYATTQNQPISLELHEYGAKICVLVSDLYQSLSGIISKHGLFDVLQMDVQLYTQMVGLYILNQILEPMNGEDTGSIIIFAYSIFLTDTLKMEIGSEDYDKMLTVYENLMSYLIHMADQGTDSFDDVPSNWDGDVAPRHYHHILALSFLHSLRSNKTINGFMVRDVFELLKKWTVRCHESLNKYTLWTGETFL